MKQNVVMIRKMGNFDVLQRTEDGFFNATKLVNQWNSIPTNPKRNLGKFWEQDNVKDFIGVLMAEENLHTPLEVYVKSKASRGNNAGTWVHPILFLKIGMWINPKFEYHVIRFVYDQLIKYRHDAGDMYVVLGSAVSKFKETNYAQIAKALNWIVFDKHEKGMRQMASQDKLRELSEVEKELAFAIDMGYIKSYNQLIREMRKIYTMKNRKF